MTVMTAQQIKEIFEPVVKEVCDLVQGQGDLLRLFLFISD